MKRRLARRVPVLGANRSPWRRWMPAVVGTLLLVLAPVIAHSQGLDSVVVSWTAAGDDGVSGTATAYDLRVSESPITAGNFGASTQVAGMPTPSAGGTRQHATVRGLTHGTTYFFAIRSVDDAGNWSEISNVLRWDWILDTSPPGTPRGLAAHKVGTQVQVSWTPNGDADLRGYRVYRATSSSGPYTALNGPPITSSEYADADVPAGAEAVWYQITALDVTGNESAKSAPIAVTLVVTVAQSVIEAVYPNPSHSGDPVQIPVVIPATASGPAVIDVVTSGGIRVRRIERDLVAGRQEVTWDGKNDAGRVVAPGVYRAWLIVGGTRTSIRVLRVP